MSTKNKKREFTVLVVPPKYMRGVEPHWVRVQATNEREAERIAIKRFEEDTESNHSIISYNV